MIALTCKEVAQALDDLHNHHQDDDGGKHDVRLIPVVAVTDGDIAQTARTNSAGNS